MRSWLKVTRVALVLISAVIVSGLVTGGSSSRGADPTCLQPLEPMEIESASVLECIQLPSEYFQIRMEWGVGVGEWTLNAGASDALVQIRPESLVVIAVNQGELTVVVGETNAQEITVQADEALLLVAQESDDQLVYGLRNDGDEEVLYTRMSFSPPTVAASGTLDQYPTVGESEGGRLAGGYILPDGFPDGEAVAFMARLNGIPNTLAEVSGLSGPLFVAVRSGSIVATAIEQPAVEGAELPAGVNLLEEGFPTTIGPDQWYLAPSETVITMDSPSDDLEMVVMGVLSNDEFSNLDLP